jgi:hypothetical protein
LLRYCKFLLFAYLLLLLLWQMLFMYAVVVLFFLSLADAAAVLGLGGHVVTAGTEAVAGMAARHGTRTPTAP